MKNNHGDIPITILVIGVFVVCALAMLSFFVASISLRNSYVGIDMIERSNENIEHGQLNNFPIEIHKKNIWPWAKNELLFSIEYEKP